MIWLDDLVAHYEHVSYVNVLVADDSFIRRNGHLEQKERLGLISNAKSESNLQRKYSTEASTALEKVEVDLSFLINSTCIKS